MNFNKSSRPDYYESLQSTEFDIVIVGGGITGAGILLDAASRGLKVALLEKRDFAEGTSSRSTKLVHGGLRYMKHFEFSLVRHSGQERAVLYQNAPHIVYPQKMILPILKGQKYGKWMTSLGLWMYDLLAGVKHPYKRTSLSIGETKKKIETLKDNGLKGAVQYYEYRTNDSRLVIETIKKANEYGGIALNYTEVLNISNETPVLKVKDALTGNEFNIRSRSIINATGPWSGAFMKQQSFKPSNYVLTSKGIHLVLDRSKLKLTSAVYIELEDERMIFAIPADDKVYVGTTDDIFEGDCDEVYAEQHELEYLIEAVNKYFNVNVSKEDVEITWAGIRPLYNKVSKSVSKVSRKEKMIWHNDFLMSIVGGKLTAYRLMAQNAVDAVIEKMVITDVKACETKYIKLSGATFDFEKAEAHKMVDYAERKFNEAYQLGADTKTINKLVYTYGSNVDFIIDKAFELYNHSTDRKYVWLEAEVWYTVEHEMLINLSDFLVRRTDRFFFSNKESSDLLDKIASFHAKYLNWSFSEQKEQLDDYKKILEKSLKCLS